MFKKFDFESKALGKNDYQLKNLFCLQIWYKYANRYLKHWDFVSTVT